MTLDQLAEDAGTTKSSVSRIENNEQSPTLDMVERLAAALDVMVYQIFAMAEGVSLPVGAQSPVESEILDCFKAMSPDTRDHYTALARSLANK